MVRTNCDILQETIKVCSYKPIVTLFLSSRAEHEAAMVKYSRLPKKKENEKVEWLGSAFSALLMEFPHRLQAVEDLAMQLCSGNAVGVFFIIICKTNKWN